ncbi:hypothetical protein PR048_016547, partial [Dryococelus australis]
MTDLRQCSREFLTVFIDLYKSFPCLWLVKSKSYSERDKKGKAYEALVQKYKEVDIAANREKITNKIISLRSVYQEELAEVRKSIRSGAGKDDVYKPSLWYFDLFAFLSDQETPRESTNTMDSKTTASTEEIEEEVIIHIFLQHLCSQNSSRKKKLRPEDEKTDEVMTFAEMESLSRNSRVVGDSQNNIAFVSGCYGWHENIPLQTAQQNIPPHIVQQQHTSTQHIQDQNITPHLVQQYDNPQSVHTQGFVQSFAFTVKDVASHVDRQFCGLRGDGTQRRKTEGEREHLCLHSLFNLHRLAGAIGKRKKNYFRSGAGDDNVYKTSLLYFDLFGFLSDQEIAKKTMNTTDDESAALTEET